MKPETIDKEHEGIDSQAVPEASVNVPDSPAVDSALIDSALIDSALIDSSENIKSDQEENEAHPALEQDTLEDQLVQATNQIKRQAAEFQNYRRRTEIEKRQMVSIGKSFVLEKLLDVFDDLHRSVTAARDVSPDAGSGSGSPFDARKSFDSLRSGLELAHQKLMDELSKLDVIIIESVGLPFDEEIHEAVMQQPAEEGEEAGIVLAEVHRGFKLGDRVLRHAKVIVSS